MAKAKKKGRARKRNATVKVHDDDTFELKPSGSGVTVGDLKEVLEATGLPDNAEVIVGIGDDEYSLDGGIFRQATFLDGRLGEEPFIQLMDWVDIKKNPSKKAAGKTKKRARNLHDPTESARRFGSALAAADRELTAAASARRQDANSLDHLLRAVYWLGVARAEKEYAGEVSQTDIERYKQLDPAWTTWAREFAWAMARNPKKKRNA